MTRTRITYAERVSAATLYIVSSSGLFYFIFPFKYAFSSSLFAYLSHVLPHSHTHFHKTFSLLFLYISSLLHLVLYNILLHFLVLIHKHSLFLLFLVLLLIIVSFCFLCLRLLFSFFKFQVWCSFTSLRSHSFCGSYDKFVIIFAFILWSHLVIFSLSTIIEMLNIVEYADHVDREKSIRVHCVGHLVKYCKKHFTNRLNKVSTPLRNKKTNWIEMQRKSA